MGGPDWTWRADGLGCFGVRLALNNQLRTGADKGNLTV